MQIQRFQLSPAGWKCWSLAQSARWLIVWAQRGLLSQGQEWITVVELKANDSQSIDPDPPAHAGPRLLWTLISHWWILFLQA